MKTGSFNYEFIVTLKDVNMYGTAYFSRYFEWQGICRELYFMTLNNYQEVLKGVILVTKYAWNDYRKPVYAFDQILIKVQIRNIKKSSYEVIFTLINKKTSEIVSVGGETIVYMDNKGHILRIPEAVNKEIIKIPYVE